jgi:hypothetical protein
MLLVAAAVLLAGPPLQVPWMCGVTKPCTQGHGGFSHTGNSQWAWDFDVNEGEEVWAASSGTVSHLRMDSTTGGCDSSYGGDANYVVVDHGDGTSIVYMHLQASSSPLEVGDAVVPGMLVGRVGLTGWVCGDHLHLAVMETCGSSYCASVSASFADYGDPAEGDSIESTNCPACTIALDGTTTIISELDPGCFVRETTAWWSTMAGDDAHHFHTMATDAAEHASTGLWRFGVEVPGDYRVSVFVPDEAGAQGTAYEVHHDGQVDVVAIDQSTMKGWQELGVFGFAGTGDAHVFLGDATGEAAALERRVAYDAIRLEYVPSTGDSGSGDATAGNDTTGDGNTTSASGTAGATSSITVGGGDSTTEGSSATVGDSSDALPDTFGEQGDDGGCACAMDRDTPASTWWLAPLAWIVRRRRAT